MITTPSPATLCIIPRVIYDRVRNRKNNFEIPAFLPFERGISRAGKFKVMLHFAPTEMCWFLFSFEFPALDVPRSKFKKGGNFKIIFPVPYPIIYYPGSYKRTKKILTTHHIYNIYILE